VAYQGGDMNLLKDPWLTFRFRDGREQMLPIVAICNQDVVDFSLPREDFQGAAYQFAIGLLQTVLSPVNKSQWYQYLSHPPAADVLQQQLSRVEYAFNATGEGPLFMQDFDLLSKQGETEVAALLIEAPGANGIKLNTDHFVKRGLCDVMSLEMAVLALFTLQINAPSGGVGHRVGLRGGGPLTTLLMPADKDSSLWQKLWLNISTDMKWTVTDDELNSGLVFPWLAPTKTSEKKGSEIYQKAVHPLHMFWAMPRRIRLVVEEGEAFCGLTGQTVNQSVAAFRAQNYGGNYSGDWDHPLTPYKWNPKKPDEEKLSAKGQPGGITYKIWDALNFSSDSEGQHCAHVVSHYASLRVYAENYLSHHPHIWVFGYDMDNMKARGWYSAQVPLFNVNPEQQEVLLQCVKELQKLASDADWQLRTQIKSAWFESPGDAKGDFSFIDLAFWQRTEAGFNQAVQQMVSNMSDGSPHLSFEQAGEWFRETQHTVEDLFDEYALSELGSERSMAKRISARRLLKLWLMKSKDKFMKEHNAAKPEEVS